MPLQENNYESVEALNDAFSKQICRILADAIKSDGRASLVVSGGRTPVAMFNALSNMDLAWDKVDITLADERWVDEQDGASNAAMVKKNLLINRASVANFLPLKTADRDAKDGVDTCNKNLLSIKTPFDVLILGMGEDGHTASLFPCSDQVAQGLDTTLESDFIAVQPTTAPNQRMSMTLRALLNSRHIFLHLTGQSKKTVLQSALEGNDELAMPIRAVINRAQVNLVWAP